MCILALSSWELRQLPPRLKTSVVLLGLTDRRLEVQLLEGLVRDGGGLPVQVEPAVIQAGLGHAEGREAQQDLRKAT